MQTLALAFSRLTLAGGVLLLIAGHLVVLPMPHTRDVGVWAYAGWRLLSGDVPYVDFFDHKPPGIFVVFALGELLGGGPAAVRLFDLAGALAAAFFLHGLVRGLAPRESRGIADLAVGLFAALIASPQIARGSAQTETLSLGLIVPSYALVAAALLRPDERPWRSAAAGVLAAGAISLRLSAVLDAGLLLAALLLFRRGRSALAFGAGSLAPASLYLLFALATGSLPAAADAVAGFNAAYAGAAAPLAESLANGAAVTAQLAPLFAGAVVAAGLGLAFGTSGGVTYALVAAWVALALFETAAPLRFFPHYYVYLAAPLCAAAAWLRPGALRGGAALAVGLASVVTLVASALAILQLGPVAEGRLSGRLLTPQERAAALVAGATRPDGPAFVWGVEPDVLYLARRRSPTRYIYSTVLAYPGGAERYAELLRDLEADPPEAVVLAPEPESGGVPILPESLCARLAGAARGSADAFERWLVYAGGGATTLGADVAAGRIICLPERDVIPSWPAR